MSKTHSEHNSGNELSRRQRRALSDTKQDFSGERIRGIDGWVITVHERDTGLTVTRRFEIVANTDSDRAPAKTVTLVCSEEELAGFRLACAEATRAELELTNPLAGLRHYRTAMLAFPFLPGLDALRDQLMAGAWNVVDASLHTADECLKQRRTWAAAKPVLERVKPLIEIEDALHVAFGARYAFLHSLAERLEKLAHRKLAQDEAMELLRDLRDELAGDPASYWHLPGWQSVRARLTHFENAARQKSQEELLALRRQFIADAGRACNDASAQHFLERYLQHGNLPPADEDIARLQLDEADALLRRADELLHKHRALEADETEDVDAHEVMRDAIALLHAEIEKLEGWRRDLQSLISGLNVARHYAALGLREPAQLDVARYVLGIGTRAPATPLRQVPAMFIGHPSWLRGKAFIDECSTRRASQEKLLREITACLQATAGATDPIEIALEKLRAMQRDEPADACGLQKELRYIDADDHQREYRGLPAIEAIVQRKVDQIHTLRDWLARFQHAGADFPGAVDWPQEKRAIETLRDSGPAGLTEAQARCRLVKAGDSDGVVDGLWPLARMCDALSQESALAHLRQTLGEANALKLCAPAQAINQQRHALWQTYERHLRECDVLAKDIASRIERYPSAWGAFEAAHHALMTVPLWRRRRIAHSAEWQHFQHTAEAFYAICPNDSAFRALLHEVQARFHLVPACLDEHEQHEKHHA